MHSLSLACSFGLVASAMSALTTNYASVDALGNFQSYHAPVSEVNTVSAPGFVKTIASPAASSGFTKVSTGPLAATLLHRAVPYAAPSSVVTYSAPGIQKTVSYGAPTLVHKSVYAHVAPVVAVAPAVHSTVTYGAPAATVTYAAPAVAYVAPAVHYKLSNPGFTKTFQTPYHSTVASNQAFPQAQKHIEVAHHL